ncbi:MAG: DUF1887 family CARF protein [Pseudomonadota bacterium]|nr:DUF1887 family CARF protein [Pseudomonadota bacterium]
MARLTHLCLVSAQATPILTPALDPTVRPERAILLVSPDMQRRADWVAQVLRSRGIKIERWPIEDAWDVEHVQTRVLELLERELDSVATGAIALNATGGTKPMSIAAYEAFRAYDLPIFYIHPEKDRLIWMHPGGQSAIDLENRVRLEPFLLAHGARMQSRKTEGVPAQLRALTKWLVADARAYGRALGVLNWLAKEAETGLVSPEMESHHLRNYRLQTLLDRFVGEGMLELRGRRLRFPDEESRFYVNGGWLEEHVYDVFRGLRGDLPHIQDLARSVTIVREAPRGVEVPNEIDVGCLAENRLYLVECKTRSWSGDGSSGVGVNALYRLDTLGDLLGGLQARAMVVSYRPLPAHVLRRAADLGVRVCAGSRLPELAAELRDWIR